VDTARPPGFKLRARRGYGIYHKTRRKQEGTTYHCMVIFVVGCGRSLANNVGLAAAVGYSFLVVDRYVAAVLALLPTPHMLPSRDKIDDNRILSHPPNLNVFRRRRRWWWMERRPLETAGTRSTLPWARSP
ncbi:unnamed protein product, partial [Ectocarpus sp. 8 AP-2014]